MFTPSNPKRIASLIQKKSSLRPTLAILLGSGFQGVLSQATCHLQIPYRSLPGFPIPTIHGHEGKLLLARLEDVPVLILSGRSHYYEGHSMDQITFPIRVLAHYGIQHLLLTNAAGGINRRFAPGDLMVLTDHINFMGTNPLRGKKPPGRERFLDLTSTYDPTLRKLLKRAAARVRCPLHQGVYLAVSGPSYETPAEIRAFARLGADAVGMSTVPEAMVARQHGLAVAALSCITNRAAGLSRLPLSHQEVLGIGRQASETATDLLRVFIRLYAQSR